MSLWQWFTANTVVILGALLMVYIIAFNKLPSATAWQAFLDSFETKGGQLMLLWVSDGLVLLLLIHFWKMFDAQLQTTIVGILSAVNGAFLGAIGAKNTSNGGAGNAPKMNVTFVPGSEPTEKKS
jgi:hypothetical protein